MCQTPEKSKITSFSWNPRPFPAACSCSIQLFEMPEEASLSHHETWARWVFFPQCGQSLKLKGPDSAEVAVFEVLVDSFKIAFFFYFRNIWRYFAVMLLRNNIFCMDMKKTWDKSPLVDVVFCWDLFPALISQQSGLDLCSALSLILHFLLQILSCNLKMTLFLSPTILWIFSFNCLPFGEAWYSTWIMDEQSFPPSLIDDGQTEQQLSL